MAPPFTMQLHGPLGLPPADGRPAFLRNPQAKSSVVSPPLDKGLYSWLLTGGRG